MGYRAFPDPHMIHPGAAIRLLRELDAPARPMRRADQLAAALAGIATELERLPWSWPLNNAAIDERLYARILARLEARA